MKYTHLVRYVAESLWAIMPNRVVGSRHASLEDILSILAFRAAGGEYTAEEIQARIGAGGQAPEPSTRGMVAVIPLRGVIANRMGGMDESSGGMSTERFSGMLKACLENDAVGSIVIDVDSPGGTVQGVPELAAELLAARGKKPIVAVANACMASAAYWIAACADEIVATPSAIVGSIGVYTAHEDMSKALEKEGVKVTLISAGKYKVEGNPFEPASDEYLSVVQERVNGYYDQFVKAVAKGRGVTASAVKAGYGQGRVLTAKDALAAGMIDRIGTLDDTLARLSGGQGRSKVGGMRAEAPDALVAEDSAAPAEATTVDVDLAALSAEEEAARVGRFRLL